MIYSFLSFLAQIRIRNTALITDSCIRGQSILTGNLHVQHDIIHKVGQAGLDGAAELLGLHQRVHKLKNGKDETLEAEDLAVRVDNLVLGAALVHHLAHIFLS